MSSTVVQAGKEKGIQTGVPTIPTVIHRGLIVPLPEANEQHFVTQPIDVMDITRLDEGVEIVNGPMRGTFDPQKAAAFLKLPKFEGERPFRETWLETLIAEVEQGTFRPESVQIITCEVAGRKLPCRMNGQHTAWLMLNMAQRKPGFVLKDVEFIQYHAKNDKFMRALYATIDAGAPRSQGNKLVSLLAGTPAFAELGTDTIRRLGEGVAFLKWPRVRGVHDAKHRAHVMTKEYLNETRIIGEFIRRDTNTDARHLLRAPVIAAMYGSFAVAPGKGQRSAYTFWEGVRSGASLAEDDPRMRLFKELFTTAVAERGMGKEKKKVSREHMFRICVYAWMAFREGRKMKTPLRTFRVKTKERPEFV